MAIFAIGIGFICSIVLYPIVYFFHTILVAPFKGGKYRKNGGYNSVESILDSDTLHPCPNEDGRYSAVYRYVVNGKQYSTIIMRNEFHQFDHVETLYYVTNPKKVVEKVNELGKIENSRPVRRIIWGFSSVCIFVLFVILWMVR